MLTGIGYSVPPTSTMALAGGGQRLPSQAPKASAQDGFYGRSGNRQPASLRINKTPPKQSLLQRLFNRPAKRTTQPLTTQITAGAQHDRKEPRNPISFEALDTMLKELDNDVDPRIGSIIKNGYASGLKHLLKVGNQIIAEMNQLTQKGHQSTQLVIFYDHPVQGTLKDPFSDRRYSYEIDPDKQVVCEVLTPRRLPKKFDAFNHWSNIARGKQGMSDLEYLEFEAPDLQHMKNTTQNHQLVPREQRFNLNKKEELADYAFQLFNMLYNLHLAREEMAQQSNQAISHYKIGLYSQTPQGEMELKDLSHLFPGCQLPTPAEKQKSSFLEIPMPLEGQRAFLERLFWEDDDGLTD